MDEWRAKAAVIPIITTVVSIFCGYAASVREEYLKYSQMMMLWYRWSAHTHKIHWQSHMARRQGRREVEVWRLLHACAFGLHSARWYHLLPRVVSGAHVCCVDHWSAGRVRASKLVEISLALSFVRADVNWRIRREHEQKRAEESILASGEWTTRPLTDAVFLRSSARKAIEATTTKRNIPRPQNHVWIAVDFIVYFLACLAILILHLRRTSFSHVCHSGKLGASRPHLFHLPQFLVFRYILPSAYISLKSLQSNGKWENSRAYGISMTTRGRL